MPHGILGILLLVDVAFGPFTPGVLNDLSLICRMSRRLVTLNSDHNPFELIKV